MYDVACIEFDSGEVALMVEKTFSVTLPDCVLPGFGWQEAEAPHGIREALVMELLRLDRISEAEAAESLDLDRWELIDVMGRYRVPSIRVTPEELRDDLAQSIQDAKRG